MAYPARTLNFLQSVAKSYAYAFVVFLSLQLSVSASFATAPTPSGTATVDCASFFVAAPALPVLDQTHLVNISVSSRISDAQFRMVVSAIKKTGFVTLTPMTFGHDLIGTAPTDSLSALSKIKYVNFVSRPSANTTEIYRKGQYSREAPEDYDTDISDHALWNDLNPKPILAFPPRDLPTIRAMARTVGITTVLSRNRPQSEDEVRDLEALYGTKLFFAQDIAKNSGLVKIPGVVLHIDPLAKALHVRGDLNPLLGHDDLLGRFNKVTEIEWIQSIDPSYVAPSVRASKILSTNGRRSELESKLKPLRALTSRYLNRSFKITPDQKREVAQAIRTFLEFAREQFPQGAFLKWKDDLATREAEQLLTTNSDTALVAQAFIDALELAKSEYPGKSTVKNKDVAAVINEHGSYSAFVFSLLFDPDAVLVQQKLDLASTPNDALVEFRVDVFDGIVVNSSFRYGYDYYVKQAAGAKRFIESFFRKLPPSEQYYSAGFDVAMLKDGSYKIIETNPGTKSSFIDAEIYPITANQAIATLLGRPTPLLKSLEVTYRAGMDAQVALIRSAPEDRDDKHRVQDIPKSEFIDWFRDRYLQEWTNKKYSDGMKTVSQLRSLLRQSGVEQTYYCEQYVLGMIAYVRRTAVDTPGAQ